MTDTLAPGAIAYAAFWATDLLDFRGPAWDTLPPGTQARWEAAAQAVRADLLPTPERPAVTTAVAEGQAVLRSTEDPGQVAYLAWERTLHAQGRLTTVGQWASLGPQDQATWKAAAQAVLADGRCHARALVQHWHAWHRDAYAPALPLLTAMHALEAWLAHQEDTP